MRNNLKKQLEVLKEWLENENMNYSSNDFKEDWKKYQEAIENAYHLNLISVNTYHNCKEVLISYINLF